MRRFEIKRFIPSIISIIILVCSIIVASKKYAEKMGKESPISNADMGDFCMQTVKRSNEEEMRAVWIPFMTLDMNKEFSEDLFKSKYKDLVKKAKENKMNTLVVHVHSHGDAMYPSKIFPWSHILKGEQGQDPNFDPLKFMIDETHNEGMEFHAWINPLRIRSNGKPDKFSENNPYVIYEKENNNYFIYSNGDIYYNPAYSEVRKLIIDGVKEIVSNYDVDAIHFDDYFYPKGALDIDKAAYDDYTKSFTDGSIPLDLIKWRMGNINTLISGTYVAIKSINPNVKFGISPAANLDNLSEMGVDAESWGSLSGYVDYLCPQIYYSFENPALPFEKAANDWKKIVTCESIKVYMGLSLYKAGSDADDGTWKNSDDILKKQIEYGRNLGYNGFMLYSIDYLDKDNTKQEVENVLKVIN